MTEPSKSINLIGLDRRSLEEFFVELGERAFRAPQLMKWIYHKGVEDFRAMTDFSKDLRMRLDAVATLEMPVELSRDESSDGTVRWVMQTQNGNAIETVWIPDGGRNTLCISSQIGCMLDCSFCATGKQGFNGNLLTSEIIGQVLHADRVLKKDWDPRGITNVVFMGMGEPLLNFDAVMGSVDVLKDDFGFGLSKRRITISTAGVVPGIKKMCGRTDVALAISLHSPRDLVRSELVPINRKYPIANLIKVCREYLSTLGERRSVTIEYTLMEGVNDSPEDARDLAQLLRGLKCKINLIPFNPFPSSGYSRPSSGAIEAFQNDLINSGYTTMLRKTRGEDIDAACGQLVGQVQDRTRRSERHASRDQTVASTLNHLS